MKNIVIAILLPALIATPALADSTGKFYLAGDLGAARYNGVNVSLGIFPDAGVKRIAAGYHISPTLAAEVGYSRFGDSVLIAGPITGTLTASSFQIAAIGSYPLGPEFDLIGKLGLASNKSNIDETTSGIPTASGSYSQRDLLIGLGGQYNINPHFSLRALYDHYGKFTKLSNSMKASSYSLGLAYNF